jgi:hypothetical protein
MPSEVDQALSEKLEKIEVPAGNNSALGPSAAVPHYKDKGDD